ncbi:hypothetical protein N9N03_02855 [Chlamydiia bacterium]|nr:hypothetical protein [Chlamydiia bacterium]
MGLRARGASSTNENYLISDRSVGFIPLTLTILATQIGGGLIMGLSDSAYKYGYYSLLYPLGAIIGLIILGGYVGRNARGKELTTMVEIFEVYYKSPFLRKAASLLSIVSLSAILVSQGIASRKLLVTLGFSEIGIFYAFWLVIIFYTCMGGLKAVIDTDMFQCLFILVTLFFLGGYSIFNGQYSSRRIRCFFMTLFFMLIEQDMGQRCLAAKNIDVVKKASYTSAAILSVVILIPFLIGYSSGIQVDFAKSGSESVFVSFVTNNMSQTVSTIINASIFMAIISTADSVLCSITSNVSFDLDIMRGVNNNQKAFISQMITLLVGILMIVMSTQYDNIVDMLMFAYSYPVYYLTVPVLMALLFNKSNIYAVYASMLGTTIALVVVNLFAINFLSHVIVLSASFYNFWIVDRFQGQA